jgi:isoleucyl-tRNA synthetase
MNFSEDLILESLKQNILPLRNTFYFFTTYANIDGRSPATTEKPKDGKTANLLDEWILSELSNLCQTIDTDLMNYDLTHSSRQIALFLDNLTNRYIRRSRRRFWKSENDGDKNDAYQTLYTVLIEFCKIAAPFIPIITEFIYRALTKDDTSVHLQSFPVYNRFTQEKGLNKFAQAQTIVRAGLAARSKHSIRVRQPLALLKL